MSSINRRTAAAVGILLCFSAMLSAARAEDDLWQTNFEAAKAKAKSENKLLLVDFTGSDWCVYCKKLKAEVFDKDEFKTAAPKHFVLVELDFPRKTELPSELKAQNDKLVKEYKVRGFPTILLLDPDGQVIAEAPGYQPGGPEKYNEQLADFVDIHASVVKMEKQLDGLKGAQRAKLLDEIVDTYVDKLHNNADKLAAWSKEIIALDVNNKAGLRDKHEFRLSMDEFARQMEERKIEEACAALEKAVAIAGVSDEKKTVAENQLARLKAVLNARATVAKLKPELEHADGLERAKLLDKLVLAESMVVPFLPDQKAKQDAAKEIGEWKQEIVKLDADNKAGLKTKYAFQAKLVAAIKQANQGAFDKARAALDEADALPDLTEQQKALIQRLRDELAKNKDKAAP